MERIMPSKFHGREILLLVTGALAVWIGLVERGLAQPAGPWSAPMMTTSAESDSYAGSAAISPAMSPSPVPTRGPLAVLVRNSDTAEGLPPFALTDPAGTIQRYVEPVPGIDLNAHVGSTVIVRHDTGRTLLASQLELPVLSMDTSATQRVLNRLHATPGVDSRSSGAESGVHRAQFVDDNDATVELLSDDVDAEASIERFVGSPDASEPTEATIEAIDESTGMEGPTYDQEPGRPTWTEDLPSGDGRRFMQSFPEEFSGEGLSPACPECYAESGAYCPHCDGGAGLGSGGDLLGMLNGRGGTERCEFFADVQFNLLRLHLMENSVGKLSEQYQLSPRFIIGFEGGEISDGRVRYWTYDQETPLLDGGGVRFEFDVLDLEATQRFNIGRSAIVVGAGFRLAAINATDDDGFEVGADLFGMTVAADARTHICRFQDGVLAWVYGGRLSLLFGDWGGNPESDILEVSLQDDNVIAEELYGGIEYAWRYRRVHLRARLTFEMQNWHSDVLAQQSGTDSIGLLGPGVLLGAQF
jgi:hypothetical protein